MKIRTLKTTKMKLRILIEGSDSDHTNEGQDLKHKENEGSDPDQKEN